MMTSLLSIFDPCSSTSISNWFSIMFISLIFISSRYWNITSGSQLMYYKLLEVLCSVFYMKSKTELVFISMFVFFLFVNLFGLLPYGFSLSSHFSFNFFFALSLWTTSMVWGFFKNFNSNIAHLTPLGCPFPLVPFMVLVETVSSLIRPMTLSLRLMSNMLAGHMILSLLGKAVYVMPMMIKPVFLGLEVLFLMFELGVAFIQAYVFSTLMLLYWKESE